MWERLGMEALGFLQKNRQAKRRAAWDRYNNAMSGIQAGQSQNAINVNVANARSQDAISRVDIARTRLMAAAKVRANSAAAGVAGQSVDDTLFDLGRNAGSRLHQEKIKFAASLNALDAQTSSLAMQRKLSQKPVTQTPSFLSHMATAGLNILAERAEDNTPTSSGTNLEGDAPTTEESTMAGPFSGIRSILGI